MRGYLIGIAGLAVSLAAPSAAAQPKVGEIILAGCRQGECAWLRIHGVDPARRFPNGVLRHITVRRGTSTHDGSIPRRAAQARIDWDRAPRASYAFCSIRRPAFAFEEEGGGLIVHFLDLFDLGGYQQNSADLYMRLCHGMARLPRPAALRRLGYRPGTRNEQVENGAPETMTRF